MNKRSMKCPICDKDVDSRDYRRHLQLCKNKKYTTFKTKSYLIPNKHFKFLKYKNIYTRPTLPSQSQSRRFKELCGCGSEKPFIDCCYRPYHKSFNLIRLFNKLKDIKIRLGNKATRHFFRLYQQDLSIKKESDELSKRLEMQTIMEMFREIMYLHSLSSPEQVNIFRYSEDPFKSAIHFETMVVDRIFPGHKFPLYQKIIKGYLKKSSSLEKECFQSYANSQFDIFEVIEVKKHVKRGLNSWFKLRNVFTGKKYEFKDPTFIGKIHIWDTIIGRLYRIDNFNLLSTSVLIINPRQKNIFLRILFYLLWHWELKINKKPYSSLIKEYKPLIQDFSNYHLPLNSTLLFNPRLREYLKVDGPIIFEISSIFNQKISSITPNILSPEGNIFLYTEAQGDIKPNSEHDVYTLLKQKSDRFQLNTSHLRISEEFSFDFIINKSNSLNLEGEKKLTFEELAAFHKEQFFDKIIEYCKDTVIISKSWINKDLNKSIDQLYDTQKAVCGSVEYNGSKLLLATYSKESMVELQGLLGEILGNKLIYLEKKKPIDFRDKKLMDKMEDYAYEVDKDLYDMVEFTEEMDECIEEDYQNDDISIQKNIEEKLYKQLIKRWFDQPLPILQGKTPKKCINDPSMRLILIEIIKEQENFFDKKGYFNGQSLIKKHWKNIH